MGGDREENSEGNKKIKAWLVARGFEKKEIQSDFPTVSKEVLNFFLQFRLPKIGSSIDIKAAFLQSERFEHEVYLAL